MTGDELKSMQDRIGKYQKLETRGRNLSIGLSKLKSDDLAQVLIDFSEEEVRYRETTQPNDKIISKVCWASQEEGLMEEIMVALQKIVADRLATCQLEMEAL